MRELVQDDPQKKEAGGVLLGRHIRGGSDVVVDMVTMPMSGDRRSRASFHRARRQHQQAIDRAWSESGGTCTYLGEWHTHAEAEPCPSPIDWRNWRRKLLRDRYAGQLFFVIVGTAVIKVWEGRRCMKPRILRPTEG